MYVYDYEPGNWFKEGNNRVFRSVRKEGYRDRIDQWNPYENTTHEIVEPISEITRKGSWYSNHYMSNYLAPRNFVPEAPDLNAVQIQAIDQFAGIVKNTELNMAVLTAEIGKSGAMIANRAHRVLRAYRSVRKGKVTDAMRLLTGTSQTISRKDSLKSKDPANTWLELQYGWRPLMSDIYEASKFESIQDPENQVIRNYFHQTDVADLKSFEKTVRTLQFDNKVKVTGNASRKTSLLMSLDARHVTNAYRLGLNDPALVAWELVPGSFLLDWFSNVSELLNAIGFAAQLGGVTFCGRSELSKSEVSETIPDWDNGSYHYNALNRTTRLMSFRRYDAGTVNFPSMHIELKTASNLLSKTATTLALLVQQASK